LVDCWVPVVGESVMALANPAVPVNWRRPSNIFVTP
jgi:hypothetical protein